MVMKPGACGPAPCGSGVSPPTRLGNILQAFEGRPANRSGSRVAGGGRSSLWPRTRRPATPQTTPYSAREIASTPDGLHCAQCADLGRAEDHRGPVLQVVLLASIPSLNRLPMPSPQHGPTTSTCESPLLCTQRTRMCPYRYRLPGRVSGGSAAHLAAEELPYTGDP